jgi:hypothetical protein
VAGSAAGAQRSAHVMLPGILEHRQAQPAVLLRQGEPVQAHLLGRLADRIRDPVLLVDLGFERYHSLADEPADLGQDLVEVACVHWDHLSGCGCRCARTLDHY